ncbi:MAG: methyl-accepting chemotaxis protein, partial [Gemmatimonadota bacterium]
MAELPSLRSRVTAGTSLLLLLVFAMTLLGVSAVDSLDNAVRAELTTVRERTVLAQSITRSVVTAVRDGDALALRPDSVQQLELDSAFAAITSATLVYGQSDLTPAESRVVSRIDELSAELKRRSPGGAAASEPGRGQIADSLLAEVGALTAVQEAAAADRATVIADRSTQRRFIVWILFVVALILGAGSAVTTVRAVVLPLRRLIEATERVGAGDLRPLDLGPMPRELGLLGAAVRRMSEGLRGVVGSVADVSATLTDNASHLNSRSEQLTQSASQVSRAIGEVSASAERQAAGMRESDIALGDLRAAAARSAGAGQRVVAEADGIRRTAATHPGHLGAASATLLELHEVV